MIFTCVILFLTLLLVVHFYLTRNYNYWKAQNVPSAPDPIPGFGHILPLFLVKENFGIFIEKLYEKMGKNSMYGCYLMRTPALLLRDPELIKSVLQKDFSNFQNNMLSVHSDLDPIASRNPFFANDDDWTKSRMLLANNFSGKKMSYLFGVTEKVCEKLKDYIECQIKEQNNSEFESKNLFERVLGEIVANYGFGIEGGSFDDKLNDNCFTSVAQKFFDVSTLNAVRQTLLFFIPNLAHCFGISFVPNEVDTFVRMHLKNFMKHVRQNKNNNDYFQFPIEETSELDEEMTIMIATSIFIDGYETTNIVLSFMIYRLAENPMIQAKARKEVNSTLEKYNNKLTYEAVKGMTYLEQIMLETLRLHPTFSDVSKVCTKEITLQGYDGLSCSLKPGDVILIAPWSIHMDEEFWPNPTIFDPDRFNTENKPTNTKYTYFGFGEGPRICPGKRMGTMMVKTIAANILRRYSLELSDKSKGPLKKNPNTFASVIEGGLWVKFKRLHV